MAEMRVHKQPVPMGFQVFVPADTKRGEQAISRRFMVREAAEEFCALARSSNPNAFVKTVMGFESFK